MASAETVHEREEAFYELFGDSESDECNFSGWGSDFDRNDDGNTSDEDNDGVVGETTDLLDAYATEWLTDFSRNSGVQFTTDGDESVLDIFLKFIDADFIRLCVDQTNTFAKQYLDRNPVETLKPNALARSWREVDDDEMTAFLGILLFMGCIKLPNYDSYWSTNYLTEMKGFRSIISRDRWLIIWSFFHVSDNTIALPHDHPDFDRIAKIRPAVDHIVKNFQKLYYPAREVSVDESLIAFKGRSVMVQYMPQKPHKWGLKAWALCESQTGYCYNWNLYTGKKAGGTEHGMTYNVVMDICRPILGNGHHVYMDNFFSSAALYNDLGNNMTGACGTLRTNRQGTPAECKAKMKKDDPPKFVRNGKLLFVSWMDKKQVTLLSSIHNTQMMLKTVRCKDPANDNMRQLEKPKALEGYNTFMGGVDIMDQKLWTYLTVHRTVKWWKKVFVYLLELCFVNFTVVWAKLHPDVRINKYKLRLTLVSAMVSQFERPSASIRKPRLSQDDVPSRLTAKQFGHFVGINPNKTKSGKTALPDCVVCADRNGKRHQTQYMCKQCERPMCPVPCHERYHTLEDYKIPCTKELHSS